MNENIRNNVPPIQIADGLLSYCYQTLFPNSCDPNALLKQEKINP